MKDEIIMKDGKPHKIAQVVMLSTKEQRWKIGNEHVDRYEFYSFVDKKLYSRQSNAYNWSLSHLYILSDEEIKEGEYGINLASGSIFKLLDKSDSKHWKVKFITGGNMSGEIVLEDWSHANPKKIIATTDESLKPSCICSENEAIYCGSKCQKSLPRLSDDFLKAFVKAQGKIDKVLVEYFEQIPDWEDDLLTPEYETVLKVVRDNTITIKPIQKEKIDIVDLAEIELKSYVNPSEEFKDGFIDGVTIGYYHKNKEAIHTWIDKGIDVFSGKKTSWSREEERLQTLYYKLKVSPDNTITIRTVEGEKKDYGIEYLKFIATRFAHECRLKDVVSNHETCTLFDKWIKENL